MKRFSAVVCGGGVAGLEALLRLRRLAGDRIDLTLVSPSPELAYRPLAVLQPFGLGDVVRYPVASIVADTSTTWIRDTLSWVDPVARSVRTGSGHSLDYDALLLAVGGRRVTSAASDTLVFTDRSADSYRRVADRLASGESRAVRFVVPHGPTWPLPLYELALLTRRRAAERGQDPEITICEPSSRPLNTFGTEVSDAVEDLLRKSRITLRTRWTADPAGGRLTGRDADVAAEHVVTLPKISGPNVRGLPGDAIDRFVAVDAYCRVKGCDGRIFGAGDATQLEVKHGSLSAQQADCAAAGIAYLAGIGDRPEPLQPILHASLLTGAAPLYITAMLIGAEGWQAQIHDQPPWHPGHKIVADELSAYLAPPMPAVQG
jgi:sulfide:quinone oxidoreductase